MDMRFDRSAWRTVADPASPGEGGGQPDWRTLLARLAADRLVRAAMAADRDRLGSAGSFDPSAAGAVTSYGDGLSDFNQTDSAAGKPLGGKGDSGAAASTVGGRGVR